MTDRRALPADPTATLPPAAAAPTLPPAPAALAGAPGHVRWFGDYELRGEIARGWGWAAISGRCMTVPHRASREAV